jgi:hypothetical protein
VTSIRKKRKAKKCEQPEAAHTSMRRTSRGRGKKTIKPVSKQNKRNERVRARSLPSLADISCDPIATISCGERILSRSGSSTPEKPKDKTHPNQEPEFGETLFRPMIPH